MTDNLRSKTTNAFGWALGGQLSNQLISFIISLILARLLTPEEFGLASLVLVANLIGQVFLDAGISAGLIRKLEVSGTELSSFFYLNVILGVCIMSIVFFGSRFIAGIFENPHMDNLIRLSSLQFFISSFGLMPSVLLRRNLDFKYLSKLSIWVNLISGLVCIVLAIIGLGVYSLILRSILSGLLTVVFSWRKTRWLPLLTFSIESLRDTFKYSLGIFGLNLINSISNNFSTVLIGKYFSVSVLGYYNRANNTRGLILKNFGPLFNKVLFPVLSKIQDEEERLKSYYIMAIQMVSLLAVYFMGILYLFAEPLIFYLFGPEWIESAPILKILSLAGVILPISNINLNLFMVKGRSRFLMRYETIKHILTALVMYISIQGGMTIFLYSLVGIAYLFFLSKIVLTYWIFGFSLKAQLLAVFTKLLPGIILVLVLSSCLLPNQIDILDLIGYGVIFSLSYFSLAYLLDQKLFLTIKDLLSSQLNR